MKYEYKHKREPAARHRQHNPNYDHNPKLVPGAAGNPKNIVFKSISSK